MNPTLTGGKQIEWTPLATFFDGRSPVDQVPWGRWRYVQNFRVDDRFGWGPRSGFRRFGYGTTNEDVADLNAWDGGVVSSLYAHLRPDGTRVLLAGSQTTISRYSADGRWTTIGTLAEGSRPVFASVNEVVVVTNGADAPKYWVVGDAALSDFDELDDIGLSQASVVASWNGVLFFGDVVMDGTRVGHRVLWSDVNNPLALAPATGRVSGFQDLDSGAKIKAILPLADVLFIFTTRSIWRVSTIGGDEQYAFQRVHFAPDGDGCLLATHAICEARGNAVYLAHDGVYIFNPFGAVPERPEWIFRASSRIDFEQCHEACVAYNPDFDEIRIAYVNTSGTREMLALNWSSQAADVIDHGATALLSTKDETHETFYEWLIRVAGCSLGTRTDTYPGPVSTYTGLAAIWPELQGLVTDVVLAGSPLPTPPPPPEEEVDEPETKVVYAHPYGCCPGIPSDECVDSRKNGSYFWTGTEAGDPLVDLDIGPAVVADLDAYVEGAYPGYDFTTAWEYSSGGVQGWNVNKWVANGACQDNLSTTAPFDSASQGWYCVARGTRTHPQIGGVINNGDLVACDSDTKISFGGTTVGTPVDKTLSIRNRGTGTLTILSVTAPAGFEVIDPPAGTVASGGSEDFVVRLLATAAGTFTGHLTVVTDSDEFATCPVLLYGMVNAVPEIVVTGDGQAISDGDSAVDPANLTDFGETEVGTSVTNTFDIENTGSGTLVFGAVTVPTGFTLAVSPPLTLAASATTEMQVRLDATAPGTYSGNVVINNNDPSELAFTFAISGVVATDDTEVCESIPSGRECDPCPARNVFLLASSTDGCLKQEEPDVFYRELRSGASYLQVAYSAILRTGCLAFDTRLAKRLQKITFDVNASSGDALTGYVYRSVVPAEPGTTGCTLRTTTLSQKALSCPNPESRPKWPLVLDSHHFTFEFRIASVTGPAWFSRLGIELGAAPVTSP